MGFLIGFALIGIVIWLIARSANTNLLTSTSAIDNLARRGLRARGLVLSCNQMAVGVTINGRRFGEVEDALFARNQSLVVARRDGQRQDALADVIEIDANLYRRFFLFVFLFIFLFVCIFIFVFVVVFALIGCRSRLFILFLFRLFLVAFGGYR